MGTHLSQSGSSSSSPLSSGHSDPDQISQNLSQSLASGRSGTSTADPSQATRQAAQRVSGSVNEAMTRTGQRLQTTSQTINRAADYLIQKNPEGLLSDLGDVIRRNPAPSLGVGLVLGLLVGRMFRFDR